MIPTTTRGSPGGPAARWCSSPSARR